MILCAYSGAARRCPEAASLGMNEELLRNFYRLRPAYLKEENLMELKFEWDEVISG